MSGRATPARPGSKERPGNRRPALSCARPATEGRATLADQRPKDGKYEIGFTLAGKWRMETLKATTLTDAKKEQRARVGQVDRGEVAIGHTSLTIEKLAESFLDRERSTLGKRSDRTVDLYRQRLETHIVLLLGPRTKVSQAQVAHTRKMADKLKAKGSRCDRPRLCLRGLVDVRPCPP